MFRQMSLLQAKGERDLVWRGTGRPQCKSLQIYETFHISGAALSSSVAGLLWRMKKVWPRETGACRRAESGKDTVVNSRNLRPQWAGREQRGRGPGAWRVWGREREKELDSTYLLQFPPDSISFLSVQLLKLPQRGIRELFHRKRRRWD